MTFEDEENQHTLLKKLLPHYYITLALAMAYVAIPQSIAFSDQFGTYQALCAWAIFIAFWVAPDKWDKISSGYNFLKDKTLFWR